MGVAATGDGRMTRNKAAAATRTIAASASQCQGRRRGRMRGEDPRGLPALKHYDLHVWLWKNNPRGMFTSTNSAVKCTPKATYTVAIGEHHH